MIYGQGEWHRLRRHLLKNENVRKSESTREKQRLLWEELIMKITCVLVTYNRLEKLKTALQTYSNQTRKPDRMVVIDNNSTDGTSDYLDLWKSQDDEISKIVVHLPQNTGGSGGFYTGLKKALEFDSDWIYVSDDDAYLKEDVFEKISSYAAKADDKVGAICATVEENDGLGYFHRRVYKEGIFTLKEINLSDSDYKKQSVELSTYSFVGTAIRTDALWNIGLPNKDFFLWYDDTEHGIRMAKRYKIVLYPDIVVHHDVDSTNTSVNWKKYYGYRNNLLAIKYNYNSRYFNNLIIMFYLSMIRDFLVPDRRPLIKMKKQAIADAKQNKLGISDIYYPGVKVR